MNRAWWQVIADVAKHRLSRHVVLFALVLGTRGPLIGNFEGESDSARYVCGLYSWQVGLFSDAYAGSMSSGYYWLGDHLAHITHTPPQNYSLMLSILSLCATLLLASIVYELGRLVLDDSAALLISSVFLTAPAIWWMGIQPHPQAFSMALAVAALYAYLQGVVVGSSLLWSIGSTVLLTAALLVKSDTVLVFPAFLGFLLFRDHQENGIRNRLLTLSAMLISATSGFLLLRRSILHTSIQQTHATDLGTVAHFLTIPWGLSAFKQAIPMVLALGPWLFLFAIIGAVLAIQKLNRIQLLRWIFLLATFCLPGWLFWFFIEGNNPRHVALFMLALLWMGWTGWITAYGFKATAAIAFLAVSLNYAFIPPNSNSYYLLSANVPGSVLALRAREAEIRNLSEEIGTHGGAACFVGSYTIPYLRLYLLQNSGFHASEGSDEFKSWLNSDRYTVTFIVKNEAGYVNVPCLHSYSFEYTADGRKQRFFGREVYSVPLWSKVTFAISGNK